MNEAKRNLKISKIQEMKEYSKLWKNISRNATLEYSFSTNSDSDFYLDALKWNRKIKNERNKNYFAIK